MTNLAMELAIALVLTTTMSAQSPQNGKPAAPRQPVPKADTVVVTGCVAQSSDQAGYMLNEATMAPRPIDSKASDRRVAAPSGDKMVLTYSLEGGEMKRHVGQKVEISASVVNENTMAMDHKDVAGTLKVKKVKVVAASCT